MHRCVIVILILLLAVAPVRAQQNGVGAAPGGFQPFHGTQSPRDNKAGDDAGMTSVLKKQKLSDFPSKTIGDAFDDYQYFVKREWRESAISGGKMYVDFTGWLKTGPFDLSAILKGRSKRAVGIKFIVDLDGSYGAVMASRIEVKTDGMLYSQPIENLSGILKNIYENREIKF